MSKTYRIGTLRDVFDKVPRDRIEACLSEVARGMVYAHELQDLCGEPFNWPGFVDWTDDGKREQTIQIDNAETGEPEFVFKATQAAPAEGA